MEPQAVSHHHAMTLPLSVQRRECRFPPLRDKRAYRRIRTITLALPLKERTHAHTPCTDHTLRDSHKIKPSQIHGILQQSCWRYCMELTDSLKALFVERRVPQGSARRLFMARTVKELGPGGQRRAERELGGAVGHSAKASMNWKAVSGVLMPLQPVGVSAWNPTCRTCSPISKPSSIARVKPTRSFVRPDSIPV